MTGATVAWALAIAVLGGGCLLLTVLTLPGNWLLLAVAGGAQLLSMQGGGTPLYGAWTLAGAFALAAAGEVLETAMGATGARLGGARRRGAWGAVIGSLAGALVGTVALAFLPLVGTLAGALIGAALGAFVGELTYRDRRPAALVLPAAGAAAGRLAGLIAKVAVGIALWTLLVVGALWA